jgi:hypothetical protein
VKYYPYAIVGVVCLIVGCLIGGSYVAATKAAKVVDMVDNSKERVAKDYNDASNAVREKGGDVMENVDAEELGDGATEGVKELGRGAKEGLKDIGKSWKDKLKGEDKPEMVEAKLYRETSNKFAKQMMILHEELHRIEQLLHKNDIDGAKEIIKRAKETTKDISLKEKDKE